MQFEFKSYRHKYKGIVYFDDEDLINLFNYKWNIVKRSKLCFYVTSRSSGKSIYMHNIIMPPKKGLVIDHINCNGLDNRKINLRYVTHAENLRRSPPLNGKKYKGVYFRKDCPNKPWAASLNTKNKNYHGGYFATEKEAAIAYNKLALKYFKDYAWLNKID